MFSTSTLKKHNTTTHYVSFSLLIFTINHFYLNSYVLHKVHIIKYMHSLYANQAYPKPMQVKLRIYTSKKTQTRTKQRFSPSKRLCLVKDHKEQAQTSSNHSNHRYYLPAPKHALSEPTTITTINLQNPQKFNEPMYTYIPQQSQPYHCS